VEAQEGKKRKRKDVEGKEKARENGDGSYE